MNDIIEKYCDENGNVHCNSDIKDCDDCKFNGRCLLNLIIKASKVRDLHTISEDGEEGIIRNGKLYELNKDEDD